MSMQFGSTTLKKYISAHNHADSLKDPNFNQNISLASISKNSMEPKMFYTQEDLSNRGSILTYILKTEILSRSRISSVMASPIKKPVIDLEMAGALGESPTRLRKIDKEPSLSKNELLSKLYSDEAINSTENFRQTTDLERIQKMKTEMQINSKKIKNERTLEKKHNVYDSLSENELKTEFEDLNCFLNTSSSAYLIYSRVVCLTIFYSLIFDCIQVISSLGATTPETNLFLIVMSVFSDSLFIADCLIYFIIPFKTNSGQFQTNYWKIAKNYLKTTFTLNFLACFPVSMVILFWNSKLKTLFAWIYTIRILKLNFNKAFRRQILVRNLELNRILKFLVILTLTIHNISCFFIHMAERSVYAETWLSVNKIDIQDLLEAYIASIYFHLVTIFTIGFGDITPTNKEERVYNCFLLIIGVLFFSFGISSLSDLFSNKNASLRQRQTELFEGLCRKYSVPQNIKDAVTKVIKSSVKKDVQIRNFDFIKNLPNNIKHRLTNRLYELKLRTLRFFRGQSHEFILYALQMIKTAELKKKDSLIGVGEFFEEFYMIKMGKFTISVVISEDLPYFHIGNLNKGNHFGDVYLFYNQQCSFSIRCISHQAELYMLSRADYSKLTQFFRFEVNSILLKSLQKLEYLESVRFILKEVSKFSCSRAHLEEAVRLYKHEYVQNEYALTDLGFTDYDISVMESKNRRLNELVIKKIISSIKDRQRQNLLGSVGITRRRANLKGRRSTFGVVDVFEGSPLEKHIENIESQVGGKRKRKNTLKHNMLKDSDLNKNVKQYLRRNKRKLTSEFGNTLIDQDKREKEQSNTDKAIRRNVAEVDMLSAVYSSSQLGGSENNKAYKMELVDSEQGEQVRHRHGRNSGFKGSKTEKKSLILNSGVDRSSQVELIGLREESANFRRICSEDKLESVIGLLNELRK